VKVGASDTAAHVNGIAGQNGNGSSSLSSSSGPPADAVPRVQLLRTSKFFAKKSIAQLSAVPEYSILVSLCDGVVSVHDLDPAVTSFPCICSVLRTRGASAFTLNILRTTTLTGETGVAVRMAVAVKRKLQFYYWKNRKFHDLFTDISLPDTPHSLAWSRGSVCVGLRGEYCLVRVGGGSSGDAGQEQLCELFPTGRNQEACVTLLDEERFALQKDEQTTFIDLDGNMKLYAVAWSEPPTQLTYDVPYLVATLPSGVVEVRTEEPRLSIQTIELPKVQHVASGDTRGGLVYAASTTNIWCLTMVPVAQQVPQLLRDKQFELAVTLSGIGDDPLDDKAKRVQQIQTLYAFDLFCTHKFKESMDVFFQLDIDTSHVVGLFPDLLPQEFLNRLIYPDTVPSLQGRELENATLALVEHLTRVRHRLNGAAACSRALSPTPMSEGSPVIKSKRQMLQILDTTLLKCYLRTNSSLVAPLLRLKENNCHLEETERALRKGQKLSELVIFYNTRGLHRKALTLLREHGEKVESPLSGRTRTIHYLQNLGPDNFDLICEFAAWVLAADEHEGLAIFTEDTAEVEALPRAKVLDYLARTRRALIIPYLKHVINEWKEENAVFHNALALEYKDYVLATMVNGEDLPSGTVYTATAEEARSELRIFLLSSSHYDAQLVLRQFPLDAGLDEERAALLGSLGRDREALAIYLFGLRDVDAAVEYCERHYKPDSDVFSVCLGLLMRAPNAQTLRTLGLPLDATPPGDQELALRLLEDHGPRIDLLAAVEALPDDTPMNGAAGHFAAARLSDLMSQRHRQQVHRGLLRAEHLHAQEERVLLESRRARLSETCLCPACHKRFKGAAAIVAKPDGQLVHLACYEREKM